MIFLVSAFVVLAAAAVVVILASRHASRWNGTSRAALGVGLFVASWVVVYAIGKVVGYAFQPPAYAETPDGYVMAILLTTVMAQLAALAVAYFVFSWIYEALGGMKEDGQPSPMPPAD